MLPKLISQGLPAKDQGLVILATLQLEEVTQVTLLAGEEGDLDLVTEGQICSDLLEAPHFLYQDRCVN